jgi:hypothetical protein
MVEGFATLGSSFHKHTQVVHNLFLSGKTVEQVRAQGILKVFFGLA